MDKPEEVRIELKSQEGTSHDPATVKIYIGDKLVSEIVASIEQKKGADGGLYPCVILTKKIPHVLFSKPNGKKDAMLFRFHLLAAAAPEEVPDRIVETALLQLDMGSLEEIDKISGILERTRPELGKKMECWLLSKRSTAQ